MINYFKPSFWRYALNDRMTWLALAVDAVPIVMVVFYGWGAEALVLLYWAENILIGVSTIGRIVWSGSRLGIAGLGMAAFLVPFFMFHYGLFCYGHGVFVFEFARTIDLNVGAAGPSPGIIASMMEIIRTSFPGMTLMFVLIVLYQIVAATRDYWPVPGRTYPEPISEMIAPYGRIATLHIAIILAGFLMLALGDPMLGVFLFIVIRMVTSVIGRAWRDRQREVLPTGT